MQRCYCREKMEDPSLQGEELREALLSMDRFHDLLGTLRVFERAINSLIRTGNRSLVVCDVGAGSGHLGKRLHRRHGEAVHYIRVEPADRILDVFPPRSWETVIQGRCPGLPLADGSVDVVLSSLVLHHVSEDSLACFLRESRNLASHLVLHHDLLRSSIAYGLTWFFTRLASNSAVAQSDGPLSVRRSRTREEWEQFLQQEGLSTYRLESQWPWRINLRTEGGTTTEERPG